MSYLRVRDTGDILRGTLEIYRKHFSPVFLVVLVLYFPFVFVGSLTPPENLSRYIGILAFSFVASALAFGALTVIISEICLGQRPSLIRALKRVLGPLFGKLIATTLLQTIAILLGLALVVIPGLIIWIWLLFSSVVVVLEDRWAFNAFKRSKALGVGHHWRTAGVIVVFMLLGGVVGGIFGGILGATAFVFESKVIYAFGMSLVYSLLLPLGLTAGVLMYYDLRVRKEAYDAVALAEDLSH